MQNNTINWWLIAPFSEQTRKDIDLNYQLSGGYMSVYLRNQQNVALSLEV